MKYFFLIITSILLTSCISTQSTIKNIDNTAVRPSVKDKAYVITEYATDSKYGYDMDYPINMGYIHERQEDINIQYFFNSLEGPKGQKISYKKVDTCCPFPTKKQFNGRWNYWNI